MKRFILPAILLAATILAPSARANNYSYYIAGDFNGWNPAGLAMTDVGGGYWEAVLPDVEAGRHEFKVTNGTWDVNFPSSNSWFLKKPTQTAPNGGPLKVTFDTNVWTDDWKGDTNLVIVNDDIKEWTAVGDWQGWDNANPATAMVEMAPGIFMYEAALAPGNYMYKAVHTGTWDAIGADNRAIDAHNLQFTVNPGDTMTQFFVNTNWSAIRVAPAPVIPEPSSLVLALTGLAGLGGIRLRKR